MSGVSGKKGLIVWGGRLYVDGNNRRAIVSEHSKAAAIRLINERVGYCVVSSREFNTYWGKTHNEIELLVGRVRGVWYLADRWWAEMESDFLPITQECLVRR